MTLAGQSIETFARWLDASSASKLSPCAHKRRAPKRGFLGARLPVVHRHDDMITKGRFGELLPVNFAEPFDCDYHPNALPLLISFEHAADVTLPDTADLGDPPHQPRVADRLASIVFKVQEADHAQRHGLPGNGWPVMAILPLLDPATTPQQVVDAFGADHLDPDMPIIVVPVFKGWTRKEVRALKAFIP